MIGDGVNKSTRRLIYKMLCGLPWAISVIGIVLASIGIYILFTLPHIGKPLEKVVERKGETRITTRYWETEEQVKLARK